VIEKTPKLWIDRDFLVAHAALGIEHLFDGGQAMGRFEDILVTIQQAAEDDASWPDMLARLADYLGSVEATLGGGAPGSLPQMLSPRTNPAEIERYFTTFHDTNTLMRDMMGHAPGKVVVDESLPQFADFQRDVFYNEWCVPQRYNRALGVRLATSTGWHGALMINSDRPIETDQVARFEAILPTLTRALEINKIIGQFGGMARSSLDVLELAGQSGILLDARGILLDCNESANRLFEEGRLRQRYGRISCADPTTNRHLARRIALCLQAPDHTSGGRMHIVTPQGVLGVHCAPYPGALLYPAGRRPAAIIIISDPQSRLRRRLASMQQRWGLTTAEAALSLALIETGSRKAAAAQRGVSDATARAQLTSIFDKTGVRKQTDLMRLLLAED
jgi:DNA-binding CsgD family transcriptional regulator